MCIPILMSRIEKVDDHLCLGIDARKVRTLIKIAPIGRECEIGQVIWSKVLLCDDVFNVKSAFNGGL